MDVMSSAPWFTGWKWRIREPWFGADGEAPVVAPGTWLLENGWRYRGLIRFDKIGREHREDAR